MTPMASGVIGPGYAGVRYAPVLRTPPPIVVSPSLSLTRLDDTTFVNQSMFYKIFWTSAVQWSCDNTSLKDRVEWRVTKHSDRAEQIKAIFSLDMLCSFGPKTVYNI